MIPYCIYVCYLAILYYIPCTQYDIEALCDSAKDDRLEDAKPTHVFRMEWMLMGEIG